MTACASAFDEFMTELRLLLLTIFCEQTCHMTKTQASLKPKRSMTKTTPSGDFQPPLGVMTKDRKRRRSPSKKAPVTKVLPAELLLDENGTLTLAVGEKAVPVAALGGAEWPLPNELLLLLVPEQQPEVLVEVGLGDR